MMMKYLLAFMMVTAAPFLSGCKAQPVSGLFIVQNGKARSVIVAPTNPSRREQQAIKELQYHLKRASGICLEVVDNTKAVTLPASITRIIIGDNAMAKQSGIDASALLAEEFRIKTIDNKLFFMGNNNSDALLWAVDYYLDTQLGVRWLWPGEVGTYVPQHAGIPLPQLDYTGRPVLEKRHFRNPLGKLKRETRTLLSDQEHQKITDESNVWLSHFQMGSRSEPQFGHAFTGWWDKYGKSHPDYFAIPPAGKEQAGGTRVKLNVSNEAVDDAIIAEWKAAGAPDNWNVCPNDGVGFDTSDSSRAMDEPPNQDPHLIWGTATANLTARYVKFWNRLILKMRKSNPNVTLSSYAYSAYRNPPLHGLKLEPGIVLALVPSYWAQDHWQKWQQAGAQLYLRPNWWHTGGVAPVLPLHREGDFFKFAQSHNMIGYDFDSLMGYWATQGPMYYVIARLSTHPEMSVDQVIDEYCSAFGKAAPDIKRYLRYWEDFTEKAAYPAPAGGAVSQPHPGLVDQIAKEHNLSASPLLQGWEVLPYLYTDKVIAEANAILEQAGRAAATDNSFVKQRIHFLQDGIVHLKLTRDVLHLGYMKKRTPEQEKQYIQLAAQLQQMRAKLSPSHVLWGEVENATERRRHIPTLSSADSENQEDLAGL